MLRTLGKIFIWLLLVVPMAGCVFPIAGHFDAMLPARADGSIWFLAFVAIVLYGIIIGVAVHDADID